MAGPFGPWLVGAAALGLAGYGVVQIARGLGGDVDKRLGLGALDPGARPVPVTAARAGLIARGVVFILIGTFLVRAAREHDPDRAGGLREALITLEQQSYAPGLFGAVALGLAAYGVFQLVEARYCIIATA